MTNMLNVPTIDHNRFTYKQGVLTTFASDLKPHDFLARVYKDSLDQGFKLKGKVYEVLFLLTESKKNEDGDVTCWVFEPTMTDSMKLNLSGVKVLVFNT
jgi:hypothetical protein